MKHIRTQSGETASALLQRVVGRFVVLNVIVNGVGTSICINVMKNGSASWRRKEERVSRSLSLSSPDFSLTEETLVLHYRDVSSIANNFQIIWEAIPPAAVNPDGDVAIGLLEQHGTDMGCLLAGLEQNTREIMSIGEALDLSLDTRILSLRRSLKKSVALSKYPGLSDYAKSVLGAFSESQKVYAKLPQLRGFGTANTQRGQGRPNKRDAQLRYFMQHTPKNPLKTDPPLNFVSYELKPLNISDSVWNCALNPRTDSIDLLMSLNGDPVFTEVKMAGDKFISSAVVQLLYYASILANSKQKDRLAREIHEFASQEDPWFCVIAEQRDESKSKEAGFTDDLSGAISFLNHADTKATLFPFFKGAIVLVIREDTDSRSFRVVEDGGHFIEWRT